MDLTSLAARSAELSNDLTRLGDRCGHDGTRNEITDIAGETLRLSTTLWRLHEAIEADSEDDHYTAAFRQDLDEIATELDLVFLEIGECCLEMQRADTPGPVPWFFKKGRVSRLQKHLVALKTTLVVMRTVLYHGKDYGIHSSPGRLAESSPHTLYEDRAILDSIFAKNRHAIEDLHNAERSHQNTSSSSSGANPFPADLSPGAHGRNLSNATGVDIPTVSDVLPAFTKPARKSTESTRSKSDLQRRFSKRGVRLGVHMSILDMGAHETTAELRKRWLQQAKSAQTSDNSPQKRMTTISEDGTGLAARLSRNESTSEEASETVSGGHQLHSEAGPDEAKQALGGRRRGNSLKLIGSPVGNAMSKLIKRLSFSHERSGDGETARTSNAVETGFTKRMSDRFRQPDVTTPEWSEEFENGALGSMKKQF